MTYSSHLIPVIDTCSPFKQQETNEEVVSHILSDQTLNMKRYLKKVAKLETCKGDTSIHPQQTQDYPNSTTATTPTTICPTIASALWRPLWPPGWHPRGSTKTYRSTIRLPLIKMNSDSQEAQLDSDPNESSVEYFASEEFEQMEDWLDEHPTFVQDYFVRKASRSLIDNWLLAHSASVSAVATIHSTIIGPSGTSSCVASADNSGSTTPVRKISAHEFERSGFFLRPMVSTTIDGTPTFLPLPGSEKSSNENLNRGPPVKTRQELESLNERELIFELVKDICNDLDVRSLCHKILKNVSIITNADRCSLFLVKGEKNDPNRCLISQLFDVSCQSTIEQMEQKEEIMIPWGKGIVGYVAQSGESVNIPDCYQDSRFTDMVDQKTGYTTRNMLCNPILDICGQVMGVAQVINKKGTPTFTEKDEHVFSQYLQFCGIGLRNAQLYERSQLENKRNQVLLDLARMVFEKQSNIENIIYRILVHIQSLLQCSRCQVLLLADSSKDTDFILEDEIDASLPSIGLSEGPQEEDIESNINEFRSFSRVFDLEAEDLDSNSEAENRLSPFEGRFPINIGITGYVATTGETLNIPDAYEDPRFDPSVDEDSPKGFKHKSILCMPIRNAERKIIGVSQLINKLNGRPFNKNDENLFEAFAIFSGMGIANTQMYEKAIKAMAKQRVTLEVLSYHASAQEEEAQKVSRMVIPSTTALHLTSLRFNDFSLDEDMMIKACIRMFLDLDLIERFQIDYKVLCKWILSVKKNYRPVLYHNWRHAFNVAQMMFAILVNTQYCRVLGELDTLALIVACLCHDLDHRGTNNSFQIKSCSPLAQLYSTSTLEHHHFDQSLMILSSQGNQILSNLSPDEYRRVVHVLEEAILATDLAVYFRKRGTFFRLIETEEYDWTGNEEHRSLLRCLLMTCCDIGAITKPWEIQRVVAELVASEFFQQGDIEKQQLNIEPIDMMNREKRDELPKMQVSFINAICLPVYDAFAKLCPTHLKPLLEGLLSNREAWQMLSDQPYFQQRHDI